MTDPGSAPPPAQSGAQPGPEALVPAMEGFAISQRDRIDRSMDTSELTVKDKAIRATRQGVLDDRTAAVLRELIRLDYVTEVHGVVSTGKEANVYGAVLLGGDEGSPPTYRALKIYKTRILAFKDRERYIEGEYRFQKGATKGYAMVQLWAQKEFRNLARLRQAAIPCPEPIVLRGHTILMEFLGRRGVSYPKLVDVKLEGDDADEQWARLYVQLLGYMRRMYHVCRLVHADLSEYNILYHDGLLYVIDVSQSVEPDHPKAYEFLRMDIKNVGRFFERRGVATLRERSLFDFIFSKDGAVDVEGMNEEIERRLREDPGGKDGEGDDEVDAEVFRQQYIPRNVHEISELGDTIDPNDPLIRHLLKTEKEGEGDAEGEDDASGSDDDEEGGAEVGSDDEDGREKTPRGHKFEDRDEKKARKQAVKEEKREKRKTKIPKHIKKQLVAKSSRK